MFWSILIMLTVPFSLAGGIVVLMIRAGKTRPIAAVPDPAPQVADASESATPKG